MKPSRTPKLLLLLPSMASLAAMRAAVSEFRVTMFDVSLNSRSRSSRSIMVLAFSEPNSVERRARFQSPSPLIRR